MVQKTLNDIDDFLEQLCFVNRQQQSYTASNNNQKIRKQLHLTSEDKNKDYVCVKTGISRSQQLEKLLKSKVVDIFINPKTGGQYHL